MTGVPKLLGERYEIGDVLGKGGMAEVRHAFDTRLGRQVAVKLLRADLATDTTFQARFRREAQSAAGLNHPSIVAVYDTGEETDANTGVSIPYIVMELVSGQTLKDVLQAGRKILPERALELTQGVLEALSYSHKAGIVHRDIKPANVMLTPTGGVKVMDFGIARAVADTSSSMTQTAAVIGTAQYLSPEQARGETVDARSDIYSAGCLLYELLVGRPPFTGDSPVSVAYQHVREQPVPPSQVDPVISSDIDAITLKSLAKDPQDRYQSAREMKADMTRVLAGQQATAVVSPVSSGATVQAVPPPPAETAFDSYDPHRYDDEEEDEEKSGRTGLVVLIVGLLLLLLAGGAFAYLQLTKGPPPAEMVQVPNVLSFTQEQASVRLQEANLVADVQTENGPADTEGTVVEQDPLSGAELAVQSTVTITVNLGPEMATVPDGLVGEDVKTAKKALDDAGFKDVNTEDAGSEPITAEKDEVLKVSPGEGREAALDDTIVLTVATGESEVPVLTDSLYERAETIAKDAGFEVKKKEQESDTFAAGIVMRQNPKAGTKADRDTVITLTVATEKPEPTPDPSTPPESEPPDSEPPNSEPPGSGPPSAPGKDKTPGG